MEDGQWCWHSEKRPEFHAVFQISQKTERKSQIRDQISVQVVQERVLGMDCQSTTASRKDKTQPGSKGNSVLASFSQNLPFI